MTYLVDANVLSEPTKLAPNAKVLHWLRGNEREIAVDSMILGEVLIGILALPSGRKRLRLEQWFADLQQTIQCLPWDAAVSRTWAELVIETKRKATMIPLLDSLIAATAITHNLAVATRNVRDFAKSGVRVIDPFI